MINVGYIHQGYPERRNIIDVHHAQFKHMKCFDVYKIADYLNFKLKSKTNLFYHNSFNDRWCKNKPDIFHFFNMVNYGKSNWVATFETMLPRYENGDTHFSIAIQAMAKKNCKQLIAMSDFNFNMQKEFLLNEFPKQASDILSKTIVLFPPQKSLVNACFKHELGNRLKVLFVGHDFFRKGGRELYKAIETLNSKGAEIHLTIVSKVDTDAFITKTTAHDKQEWKRKISESKFCTYFESKPNHEVMSMMKEHHVFAVPSLQETFGYVVLEAQACAIPVLTTSIRAFPEINNNDCGFVVDIPQDTRGVANVQKHGYGEISELLTNGIIKQLNTALDQIDIIQSKGEKALERIQVAHSPATYADKLWKIYSN